MLFRFNIKFLFILIGRGGGAGGAAAKKVAVEPHRHEGIFIARSKKDDLLLTRNLVPGDTVYNEKKVIVDVSFLKKEKEEEGNLIYCEFSGRKWRKG